MPATTSKRHGTTDRERLRRAVRGLNNAKTPLGRINNMMLIYELTEGDGDLSAWAMRSIKDPTLKRAFEDIVLSPCTR
jgi:hypothetical protein